MKNLRNYFERQYVPGARTTTTEPADVSRFGAWYVAHLIGLQQKDEITRYLQVQPSNVSDAVV